MFDVKLLTIHGPQYILVRSKDIKSIESVKEFPGEYLVKFYTGSKYKFDGKERWGIELWYTKTSKEEIENQIEQMRNIKAFDNKVRDILSE